MYDNNQCTYSKSVPHATYHTIVLVLWPSRHATFFVVTNRVLLFFQFSQIIRCKENEIILRLNRQYKFIEISVSFCGLHGIYMVS